MKFTKRAMLVVSVACADASALHRIQKKLNALFILPFFLLVFAPSALADQLNKWDDCAKYYPKLDDRFGCFFKGSEEQWLSLPQNERDEDVADVKRLLDEGASLRMALQAVVLSGNMTFHELVIARNPSQSIMGQELNVAACAEHFGYSHPPGSRMRIIRDLIAHGARFSEDNPYTSGCTSSVEVLALQLEQGISPSSSLHYVVSTLNISAVEFLLDKGANPNILGRGPTMRTPLALLAMRDSSEACQSGDGNTSSCYARIAELLIQHGADVNKPDADGRTPLMIALNVAYDAGPGYLNPKRGFPIELITLLLKNMADPNIVDHTKRAASALTTLASTNIWGTYAVPEKNYLSAFEELKKFPGIDFKYKDAWGMTAAQLAESQGYNKLAAAIIAAGG